MTETHVHRPGDDRFWVVDPVDITRIIGHLRVCGFSDRSLAEEEANETAEDRSYYEVRVIRHHLHIQR